VKHFLSVQYCSLPVLGVPVRSAYSRVQQLPLEKMASCAEGWVSQFGWTQRLRTDSPPAIIRKSRQDSTHNKKDIIYVSFARSVRGVYLFQHAGMDRGARLLCGVSTIQYLSRNGGLPVVHHRGHRNEHDRPPNNPLRYRTITLFFFSNNGVVLGGSGSGSGSADD
jgi:hypothetical protein